MTLGTISGTLEGLLLLLEHVVIELGVKGNDQILPYQVCLENRTIPEV